MYVYVHVSVSGLQQYTGRDNKRGSRVGRVAVSVQTILPMLLADTVYTHCTKPYIHTCTSDRTCMLVVYVKPGSQYDTGASVPTQR